MFQNFRIQIEEGETEREREKLYVVSFNVE